MMFVAGMLEDLSDKSQGHEIEYALRQIEHYAECYYLRVYELQERVFWLVKCLCKDDNLPKTLKERKKRNLALNKISQISTDTSSSLEELLLILYEDIDIRDKLTHNEFLRLGLWTDTSIYDPNDALMDMANKQGSRAALEEILWRECRRLAKIQSSKASDIFELSWKILEAADSFIKH